MAERIQIKRSDVPGRVPLSADLVVGELAINTADGKLFTKLADGSVVEIPVRGPIRNVTDITEENYNIGSMFEIAALAVENIWAPNSDALSVVPTAFFASVADTTNGDMVGDSHQISVFNHHVTKGGGSQAGQFGQEFRVRQEDGSHLGIYTAIKYVIEPTSSNNGTLGEFSLETFDDMRGAVTHVSAFTKKLLDPRIHTVYAGSELRLAQIVSASREMTDADSGRTFVVLSSSDITLGLTTVTDGWSATFIQADAGRAVFGVGGMTVLEPDGLTATQGVGHTAQIVAAPASSIVSLTLTKPTAFHSGVRPGRLYGAYGRNTMLPVQNNALTASVLYVVPILVPRSVVIDRLGVRVTTAVAGQNLRLCLFANDGAGLPGARLYQSADISTGTTGDKQVSGIGVRVPAGVHFVGLVTSGAPQVQWACSAILDSLFGRATFAGTEMLPVYSYAITAVPANLTGVAPSAYIDSFSFVPDICWGA